MPAWLNDVPSLIADALFASPLGVLYFHRLCLAESVLSVFLLVMQLILFGLMDPRKHGELHLLWLVKVVVPMFGIVFRLPSVLGTHRRCENILGTFRYRSVIEDLDSLMEGRESKVVRMFSALLCFWFFFCILWLLLLPPCGDLATNPDAEWEFTFHVSAEKGPCVIFECSCTLMLFTSGGIVCGSTAVLHVLRRFPRNFSPVMGGALPQEFIERLPTQEVKEPKDGVSESESRWIGMSCSICLQDFEAGDRLRVLPCGHGFHAPCADGWLQRASACPMRCEGDLRQAAVPETNVASSPLGAALVEVGGGTTEPSGALAAAATADVRVDVL